MRLPAIRDLHARGLSGANSASTSSSVLPQVSGNMKKACTTPQKQKTPKIRYARHWMFLNAGGTKYALCYVSAVPEITWGVYWGKYRAKLKAQLALVASPTPLARYLSGKISLT